MIIHRGLGSCRPDTDSWKTLIHYRLPPDSYAYSQESSFMNKTSIGEKKQKNVHTTIEISNVSSVTCPRGDPVSTKSPHDIVASAAQGFHYNLNFSNWIIYRHSGRVVHKCFQAHYIIFLPSSRRYHFISSSTPTRERLGIRPLQTL